MDSRSPRLNVPGGACSSSSKISTGLGVAWGVLTIGLGSRNISCQFVCKDTFSILSSERCLLDSFAFATPNILLNFGFVIFWYESCQKFRLSEIHLGVVKVYSK